MLATHSSSPSLSGLYELRHIGDQGGAVQQVETAPFFLPSVSGQLTGELVCYGRSVVHGEWDRMRTGTLAATLNPWGIELFPDAECR
jgi:hypothetical protein